MSKLSTKSQKMKTFPVLIIEDDQDMADLIAQYAKRLGFQPEVVLSYEQGVQAIDSQRYEVIVSDLSLPDGSGLDLLEQAKALNSDVQFALITGYANVQTAIKAFKLGLNDMLTKPFETAQLKVLFERLYLYTAQKFRMQQVLHRLQQVEGEKGQDFFESKSQNFLQTQMLVEQVAPLDVPVLIQGETGAGKSKLAKRIHQMSPYAEAPYFEINCAAIPENLIESELFGHEKGAFTGASQRKLGLLELADGGTLLLDEINSMQANVQAKLLHFLQNQTFVRVGGQKQIQVSVRLIFASNQDLKTLVDAGGMREDLYYRINIFPIVLPPLRARKEDIPALAEYFLATFNHRLNKRILGFSEEVIESLVRYEWPGNIRELENIVQRAVVLCQSQKIEVSHLPMEFREVRFETPCCSPFPEKASLAEVEQIWIDHILQQTDGNKQLAAQILGINPSTLHRKLAQRSEKT